MKSKFSLIFLVVCMSTSLLIGTTVYDIQYTTIAGDGTYPSLLVGQTVTFTGIVTATGYYSSGNSNRFFVSDPAGGAWKGVFIFSYDYSVSQGDEVEVTGEVQEYFGLTEIGNLTGVTVLSTGNPVPAAISVTTGDLMAPSTGEPYEGCLVKISDVTTTQAPIEHGEWYVNDGSGECQIDDAIYTYDNPTVGESFASITGAVDYSYDLYGINPRDASDFATTGGDTTPPTINSANASNETTVGIIFSEGLDQTTAETASNYTISPALTITDATLQNNNQVILTTGSQESGTVYTVTVNDVEDLNGNVIVANSTVNFTGYTPGSGPDLFFSEYIEGNSQNKALEVYNGSGATVDLSQYRIAQSVNGNGWQFWHEFSDGITLDVGDVWVIVSDQASQTLLDKADEALPYSSFGQLNGNDARGLEKTTDEGTTWTLIDIIGNPDEDPGTGWDVAGTPNATLDHTLVRKSSITEGTTDWTSSAGTTAEDSQWIVYPVDTFEYLGAHGENDTTPPTLASAYATSATAVEVTFDEQVDQTTAQTIANYSIGNLTITDAILQSLGKTVELITTAQDEGYNYTITVNNVEDLAGNVILPNSTIGFTGYEEGPTEGQLIFSEYIEGSSNNKALEIYNASSQTVYLNDYRIIGSYDGSGWNTTYYAFPDGATLGVGDVWVIANEGSAQTILAVADDILAYNAGGYVVSFNGNDARGIEMTSDGGATWTLIDVFGNPNEDPGDAWDVAGTPGATKDHTLVRKSSVTEGTTDWTTSAGTTADNSHWIVYPIDTFEYLGYHTSGDTDPYIVGASTTSSTNVNITFNEQISLDTAQDTLNYIIATLTISDAVLQAEGKTVALTTSEQIPGENYTIDVNGIQDLAGNTIEPGSTVNFTGYQVGSYTPIADIQDNYGDYEGQEVTIQGIVTIGDGLLFPGKTKFYIQDSSGKGIQVFNNTSLPTIYQRGDKIEVTGIIDKFDSDVEITNPDITLLSTGENLPVSHSVTGNEDETWNGTWSEATGTITDVWDGSEYGFYQITVEINKTEIDLMFWNTAVDPDSLTQYIIGDEIKCYGIIAFYEGAVQLTCGYDDDISYKDFDDNVTISPTEPEPGEAVTITLTYTDSLQTPVLYWNTVRQNPFSQIAMSPAKDYSWEAELPGQDAGTVVFFYIAAEDAEQNMLYFPEYAPDEVYEYDYGITDFSAILKVPHYTFCPTLGETFQIQFHSRTGDKLVLRLYNSEGVLVNTFTNEMSTGMHTFEWDGKDDNWNTLPPGLYICNLEVVNPDNGDIKNKSVPIVISAPLK